MLDQLVHYTYSEGPDRYLTNTKIPALTRGGDFLRRFENIPTTPHVDALRASTPHSMQPRRFPDFGFQTSPVGRDEVSHPEHSTMPHTRGARTEDQADSMETHMGSTRNTLPHTSSARTGEHVVFRDTHIRDEDNVFGDTRIRDQDDIQDARTREHSDERNTRSRDLR